MHEITLFSMPFKFKIKLTRKAPLTWFP